jgi:uroporphyrinogen-III synthase
MRIAITRPAEDAAPLKAKLEALGHEVITAPLMAIRPRHDAVIPDRPWQAIAATSANSIRALVNPERYATIPTLTVGPQSLKAALAVGLAAEAHGGDVEGLARFIRDHLDPDQGPILYVSGAETAGDLEAQLRDAGFDCTRVVLYDAVLAESLGELEACLRKHAVDAVLLYSPRTARIWLQLVEKGGLGADAALPAYLCLSRNVAAVLPESWSIHVAATPDERAMLALLEQTARTG